MQLHRLTLEIANSLPVIIVRAAHAQKLIDGSFEYLDSQNRVVCLIPPTVISSEIIQESDLKPLISQP